MQCRVSCRAWGWLAGGGGSSRRVVGGAAGVADVWAGAASANGGVFRKRHAALTAEALLDVASVRPT